MSLIIGLLSFILVLVCLALGLLILIQLPKKEAGMGAAFGADTTAALFGAGGGNALTNLTKWLASTFIVLCVLVSSLTAYQSKSQYAGVRKQLNSAPVSAPIPAASTLPTLPTLPQTVVVTNSTILVTNPPTALPAPKK